MPGVRVLRRQPGVSAHVDLRGQFILPGLLRQLRFAPGMTRLDLSHNTLAGAVETTLARILPSFPALERLWLENTGISDQGLRVLAPALPRLPHLTGLGLGSNLQLSLASLTVLAAALPACKALRQLTLARVDVLSLALDDAAMGEDRMRAMALHSRSGRCQPMLEQLKLVALDVRSTSLQHLEQLLALASGLRDVSLDEGETDSKMMMPEILALLPATVERLHVTAHAPDPRLTEQLAKTALNCPRLSSLALSGEWTLNATAMRSIMLQCRHLTAVTMSQFSHHRPHRPVNAKEAGFLPMRALFELLPYRPGLRHLDFSRSGFGELTDAGFLGVLLLLLPELETLRLARTGVTINLVHVLAAALPSCACLHTIDVSGNNLKDSCVMVLSEALVACRQLQSLAMNFVALTDRGICSLATSLRGCQQLTNLELDDRGSLGAESAQALAMLLMDLPGLVSLALPAAGGEKVALFVDDEAVGGPRLNSLQLPSRSHIPGTRPLLSLKMETVDQAMVPAVLVALARCPALRAVDLFLDLEDADVGPLIATLASMRQLTLLSLRYFTATERPNFASGSAATMLLTEMLPVWPHLSQVALHASKLALPAFVAALAARLPLCPNLTELSIFTRGWTIEEEQQQQLASSAAQCPLLRQVGAFFHDDRFGMYTISTYNLLRVKELEDVLARHAAWYQCRSSILVLVLVARRRLTPRLPIELWELIHGEFITGTHP